MSLNAPELAGLALLGPASIMATANPASAEVEHPFCMMQGRDTPQSCTFTTIEQCQASLSGNAGFCDTNPRYFAARPARQRR